MLGAGALVVKLALTDRDIRRDGWPRAKARPEHPGAIIEFDSRHGWLSYHDDKYTDWRDNVRALALTLQALRAVERWGALRGEQYQGSRPELEAGRPGIPAAEDLGDGQHSYTTPSRPAPLTPSRALVFLEEHSGTSLANADRANLERAYRQASLRLHPDQGGNPWLFARLQEARALLLPERSRR
ncbi:MAG: J domain-containing protein [Actinomycetota bacterium]|nr:J domain-containing protein [Actinomycetota bacterium]